MAYSEIIAEKIRKSLAYLTSVEEKKMFGGLAFMINNKMCVAAGPGRMMCRIDPGVHSEAITIEGCETVVMGGREYKGYVYISEDCMLQEDVFNYWISLALDFNKKTAL